MVSDDTLTDTWIVRDVVGDDNQSYVDVSMKKRNSRWPMQFTQRLRFDQQSLPPYLPPIVMAVQITLVLQVASGLRSLLGINP
ncbi:MAG: hypothetical protein IPP80_14405 [Ignavibacteria bacterium]|nr:hypothetical protein [Ignavibacteria bacterium]